MFQGEADENMVECPGSKGEVTDIRLPEGDIGQLFSGNVLPCLSQRLSRNID
jgi:hypothetical protein